MKELSHCRKLLSSQQLSPPFMKYDNFKQYALEFTIQQWIREVNCPMNLLYFGNQPINMLTRLVYISSKWLCPDWSIPSHVVLTLAFSIKCHRGVQQCGKSVRGSKHGSELNHQDWTASKTYLVSSLEHEVTAIVQMSFKQPSVGKFYN